MYSIQHCSYTSCYWQWTNNGLIHEFLILAPTTTSAPVTTPTTDTSLATTTAAKSLQTPAPSSTTNRALSAYIKRCSQTPRYCNSNFVFAVLSKEKVWTDNQIR